jgi:hypothetical protein
MPRHDQSAAMARLLGLGDPNRDIFAGNSGSVTMAVYEVFSNGWLAFLVSSGPGPIISTTRQISIFAVAADASR